MSIPYKKLTLCSLYFYEFVHRILKLYSLLEHTYILHSLYLCFLWLIYFVTSPSLFWRVFLQS